VETETSGCFKLRILVELGQPSSVSRNHNLLCAVVFSLF
jgi:hypothetical protein